MASFSENDWQGFDYRLLQCGAVTLYRNEKFLVDDANSLKTLGYRIHRFKCSNVDAFRESVSPIFDFAGNFGYPDWNGNLNALDDAFRELDFSDATGLAFVLQPFSSIVRKDRYLAESFLDLVELHSRDHLLFGNRLIAIVQVGDPRTTFDNLGCRSANWNHREWLDKNRGL